MKFMAPWPYPKIRNERPCLNFALHIMYIRVTYPLAAFGDSIRPWFQFRSPVVVVLFHHVTLQISHFRNITRPRFTYGCTGSLTILYHSKVLNRRTRLLTTHTGCIDAMFCLVWHFKKRQLCLIKLVGVPQVCAVAVCNFIWAWHRGPVLGRCGRSEVGVSRVTFEPRQVLMWAWHGVKGETMAVNKAECTTGSVEMRWSCVGIVAERPRSLCILALWMQWGSSGIVCRLPVANQHLVESGFLWGTGLCCCGCGMALSGLVSGNINWTLSATPLWDTFDTFNLSFMKESYSVHWETVIFEMLILSWI